jgi:hypothetical protein
LNKTYKLGIHRWKENAMDMHQRKNITQEVMACTEIKYHGKRRQLLLPEGEDTIAV